MDTTIQPQRVYPGLMCDSVELFHDGKELKAITGGRVKSFSELSFYHFHTIREAIAADQEALAELMRMHPDSEMKRIEQFAICNFSGLDHEPDIRNGVLQQGEYWDCPKRGLCTGEGKICKALKYKDNVISPVEVTLMKMIVTTKTNEVIAAEMFLPLGTFHLFKRKLYEKLGVETKQEVALIAVALNIIQATI
jgi:DNA-binding CsgD family transcriptional regulator